MVVESSVTINTAAGCSNQGAQKIAVILANFPGYPLPTAITPDFVRGVMLGNAATSSTYQSNPDRSISDFWLQNSDGKTWVNDTGSGALTIVPVTLGTNYDYCNNAAAMRTEAYAAADGIIDYNTFSRVVIVVPNNGSCAGTAGVASIGCWSGECPGDGACNISWTWWRADQMSTRGNGVMLGSHEMGHNLGVNHSGSRYHGSEVVGNVGVAGFRTEYNDRFATMGNWNYGFYNAPHALNTLGWLSTSNVQTVTATGVYTIQGFNTRPAGMKALKVARGTGMTDAYFYLAFYPNTGNYLSGLNSSVHNGVIVHYNDSQTPGLKTDLLDFTPTVVDTATTTPDFSNPILPLGATWTDPYRDVQLQVMNIDTVNNTATVNIIYTPPPCTASNPTVTFLTTSATVNPAGAANYSVRVLNNDSISCSARTFNLSSVLTTAEPSISLNYQTAAVSLAPGATADVVLTAATTSSTPVGTYVIDATATSGTNSGSTAMDASLTVQITPPATPTSSASSVYSGNGKNKVFQYVRVSWTNVASETGYEIQRCTVTTVNKVTTCVYAPLTTAGANVTSINDVPPSAGTYRYQVRAVNSNTGLVSNWSNAAQASRN